MELIEQATAESIKADITAIQALLENPDGQCCGKKVHEYKSQFDAVAGHLVSIVLTLVAADDANTDNNWIDWIEHYIYSR